MVEPTPLPVIRIERQNPLQERIAELETVLGVLLDAHWPLVETQDHEDPICRQARAALAGDGQHPQD